MHSRAPLRLLLPLLLLPALGPGVQGCPSGCQCNQPRTVFCTARRGTTVPLDVPPDTVGLYVFENGITTLDAGSFAGLPGLQLLDLSQNQIASLPGGVFQPLANLSNLDLTANRLREITNETFRGLRRLERLYLGKNRIRHIQPGAFDVFDRLLELKLQDNELRALPPLRLPRLLLLDLSHNSLSALEPGVLDTANVETLRLAGLGLRHLDEGLFGRLRHLHNLDVAHLAGLVALQELDLSNLSLQALPHELSTLFPRLRLLEAARNPFNCVCPLSWFGPWVRESRLTLASPEETRCHFPPKNAGRLLLDLDYSDFGCPATTTTATAPTTRAPVQEPTLPPSTAGPVPPPRDCPASICLNGGTCHLGARGHLECLCPQGFTGLYCEGRVRPGPRPSPAPATQRPLPLGIEPASPTSLRVGLQRFQQGSAVQLKSLRLTYRNLSGPDKRQVGPGAGPLELEGVKAPLEPDPKALEGGGEAPPGGLECEVPLMGYSGPGPQGPLPAKPYI
ncbi:PREDICTED: vasorin [Bison bison bison]|uniref:Vasorin n=1 Tax=Bison bison bison TaxID=43346 RepID=A0A6P3H9K2_BISBB|nr:PREDICTED: vasorin [Bison bison bison]